MYFIPSGGITFSASLKNKTGSKKKNQ